MLLGLEQITQNPEQPDLQEMNRKKRVYYKCPVGGFASLRFGRCPKCGEILKPVVSIVSADNRVEQVTPHPSEETIVRSIVR